MNGADTDTTATCKLPLDAATTAYTPPPPQNTYIPPPSCTNAPTMLAPAAHAMPQTTQPIPTYVPANTLQHTQTQQWSMLDGQGRGQGRGGRG